jgi:hypothetical protein
MMYFRMAPSSLRIAGYVRWADVPANPPLAKSPRARDSERWSNGQLREAQALQPGWMAEVRESSAPRWPARGGAHGEPAYRPGWGFRLVLLALLAIGGGLGLWLWGKWGFLIAFDAVMAYCF